MSAQGGNGGVDGGDITGGDIASHLKNRRYANAFKDGLIVVGVLVLVLYFWGILTNLGVAICLTAVLGGLLLLEANDIRKTPWGSYNPLQMNNTA